MEAVTARTVHHLFPRQGSARGVSMKLLAMFKEFPNMTICV